MWFNVVVMLVALGAVVALIVKPAIIARPFDFLGGLFAPYGMTRLMNTYGAGMMHVTEAPGGDIYTVDKNVVTRYAGGDTEQDSPVYTTELMRRQWGRHPHKALSRVLAADDGAVYAGTWYGAVYRLDQPSWKKIVEPETGDDGKTTEPGAYPRSQIKDMLIVGDRLYIAGRGLWVADLSQAPPVVPTPIAGFDHAPTYIYDLTRTADGDMLAATSQGLYRLDLAAPDAAPTAQPVQTKDALGGATTAVAVAPDGSIICASGGNVLVLSPDGALQRRYTVAEQIDALAVSPAGDWLVVCRKTGLQVYRDDFWYSLPFEEGLNDAMIDSQNRLWVIIYSQAAMVGDFDRVMADATLMQTVPSRDFAAPAPSADSEPAAPVATDSPVAAP